MRLAYFLFSTQFIGVSHSVSVVLRFFNKRKINAVHWYSYPMVKSLLYTPRLYTLFAMYKYISLYHQASRQNYSNFRLQRIHRFFVNSFWLNSHLQKKNIFQPFLIPFSIRVCRQTKLNSKKSRYLKLRNACSIINVLYTFS